MRESLVDSNVVFSSKFHELLQLLSEEDQYLLKTNSHIRHCKPGTILYAEGDNPSHLLFLNTGKVKIYKRGVSQKNQIIRLIKDGWFFGYRALLAEDDQYQSAAEVFDDAQVVCISKDLINSLIHKNHKLAQLFIHILAYDLAKSNEHTLSLTQKHLRGRLSSALLILADTYGYERDGETLLARMARGDLAELANMTIANSSRVIGEFAQEGLVAVSRRTVKILNKSALEHISVVG